jgi:hypothetical protein
LLTQWTAVPRTLSYADAVRLLGGQDNPIVTALDRVTGGLLLAAAPVVPAVLAWFDAKAEFVRLGHQLVRSVAEKRSGLSRFSRTQRIEAAHAVLVVTAYFEALAEADLPFRFADVQLTRAEQEALVSRLAASTTGGVVAAGLTDAVPLPQPQEPPEEFRYRLDRFYRDLSAAILFFVRNLALTERFGDAQWRQLDQTLAVLKEQAPTRYDELVRRLAVDFPEVAWWAGQRQHEATRAELRAGLALLAERLDAVSTGRLPDERRAALARAYAAALDRPVVDATDAPTGVRIPTLAEAYVEPAFRVAEVAPGLRAADESWWAMQPSRDDLAAFLPAYLTSSRATAAPLLVLGQPGSGKSVLTRMLAAHLPAADFLPVRVVLRDVPADADVQDQIEYAVRDATGERLEWPVLARSAGDALPVVLLDGFDELLQATGVSQTDYLVRIARFQQREADQGRPLAVVVTSRTSVADRARPPQDTLALLLEPFDGGRIAAWLERWNAVNAARLRARGLRPLDERTVRAHRELAGQPLLLLMLALYDADGNALRRDAGRLERAELYEKLLRRFAEREVTKTRPGLSDRDLAAAVEDELRKLSVVAFAMFNRGTQWITEADLESDLHALFGPAPAAAGRDLRGALGAAETVLGRFFFVHRSQASRGGEALRTYEFLHATFGEFLVARLTWLVLRQVEAREAAGTFGTAAPVDDDMLYALLSYAPLSSRPPVLDFLLERAVMPRRSLVDLLVGLFRAAHEPRPARAFAGYEPRRLGVPARHAAYTANLVLLAAYLGGAVTGADLFGADADRPGAWHAEALLWRSQLSSEDWSSVVDALRLERILDPADGAREVRASPGHSRLPGPIDPRWTYAARPPRDNAPPVFSRHTEHDPRVLYRKGYFQAGHLDDVALHALAPVAEHLAPTLSMYVDHGGRFASLANDLFGAWLLPVTDADDEERHRTYHRCALIVNEGLMILDAGTLARYAVLLLDRLATDPEAPAGLVADVAHLVGRSRPEAAVTRALARVVRAFLGLDGTADVRLADALTGRTLDFAGPADRPVAEVFVALCERELWRVGADDAPKLALWPDLAARMRALTG